ncbi:MAG: stress responsive protein [Rhodobacter sp. CACIA14H1]|nr:MAG: stress responsive protein [Rhodobacter sp. CACIA14H1]
MIRHVVLIRFRPDVTGAQAEALLAPLAELSARLGFAATWGRSESPERIERGYMHGFVADFADWAALAAYQADSSHKAFGAGLVAHAEGGLDGILVFDLATA